MDKKEIWIATANKNKVAEFQNILRDYEVHSLLDLNPVPDIKEDGKTFEENAIIKAKQLALMINKPVIADDSGLCITHLENWPGIYSKRWAYPTTDPEKINDKLLKVLKKRHLLTYDERKAQMVTVIAYFNPIDDYQHCFTGVVDGHITLEPRGENVFGYDQIFEVDGTGKTFSELAEQKNEFSHRRRAINKFLLYINNNYN